MTEQRKIEIQVPAPARVEGGEGALDAALADLHIQDLKLRIYEPPGCSNSS